MSNNIFTANEDFSKLFDEFLFFQKSFFSILTLSMSVMMIFNKEITLFSQEVTFFRWLAFVCFGLFLVPKINKKFDKLIKTKHKKLSKYFITSLLIALWASKDAADFLPSLIIYQTFALMELKYL